MVCSPHLEYRQVFDGVSIMYWIDSNCVARDYCTQGNPIPPPNLSSCPRSPSDITYKQQGLILYIIIFFVCLFVWSVYSDRSNIFS